ncbi:Oxidoreductase, molybdopterin-binding domain-containing protein [Exophiala viscosa]|uniref:Oxidoreductase, molybdopterin-binding domain-containing protein n=1 Tax=Exophiala viscosa TaxID=2486360 RepID=A0AAN6DXC9_9EURO|nr:Oxidoreductase, molybdopterin-binding domain-containing protein [Exophiala viscosa]
MTVVLAADEVVDFPFSEAPLAGEERRAFKGLHPSGFFIRHPSAPHHLNEFYTSDDDLFQTIHMGAAVVDCEDWLLTIDGLVQRPFALSLDQLRQLPRTTLTAFHECYGSPIKPPTEAVSRIGNVTWTGVPLYTLLMHARPLPEASFIWSEGLDSGEFAGVKADRYQKDLPLKKALSKEVLVAYEMNGKPLTKKRGGPVRLVVPGWFGTNSTKWLCKISLQSVRAPGPFTTVFYNEQDPTDPHGLRRRPVWQVEVNSIITCPAPDAVVLAPNVQIQGWAWSHDGVGSVEVSADQGGVCNDAHVGKQTDFSWQKFSVTLQLPVGDCNVTARATSSSGLQQPLRGRRNHVHTVHIVVEAADVK